MKLRLTRRAIRNLREIADYLRPRSASGALHVVEAIEASFEVIAAFPRAGRAFEKGLRRLAVPRYPYLIYYRIDEPNGFVEIVTVRHSARAPE